MDQLHKKQWTNSPCVCYFTSSIERAPSIQTLIVQFADGAMDLLSEKKDGYKQASAAEEVITQVDLKPSVDVGSEVGCAETTPKEKTTDYDEGPVNDAHKELEASNDEHESSDDDDGAPFYAMHFKGDGVIMQQGEGMPSSTMMQLMMAVQMMEQRKFVSAAAAAAQSSGSAGSTEAAPAGLPLPRGPPKYPQPKKKMNKKR